MIFLEKFKNPFITLIATVANIKFLKKHQLELIEKYTFLLINIKCLTHFQKAFIICFDVKSFKLSDKTYY